MYSRNFTTDNTLNTIKLNSSSSNRQGKIPVKSFTDNFAYERFNKMGAIKESQETADANKAEAETQISHETPTLPVISETIGSVENKKEEADNSILKRLKDILDSDSLLIILAVIMLIFSDNATNDKLTPLALLAILFL